MGVVLPKHKAGLSIEHNEHLNYYETVENYLSVNGAKEPYDERVWNGHLDYQKAVETNELWRLQWYPDTPVGSHYIYAPTFAALMKAMIIITEGELAEYE